MEPLLSERALVAMAVLTALGMVPFVLFIYRRDRYPITDRVVPLVSIEVSGVGEKKNTVGIRYSGEREKHRRYNPRDNPYTALTTRVTTITLNEIFPKQNRKHRY